MTLPRFYPILDTGLLARRRISVAVAALEFLSAGVQILQFRHKGSVTRTALDEMESVARLCRDARVPFVVNDRADLARIFASALHLGQDDLPPKAARLVVGEEALVGFSTHNEAQLRASEDEPVNYVALGPTFRTSSKENPDPVVGLKELQRLRPLTTRPLVAIGGITRENAPSVLAAGADSVAIISDLIPEQGAIRARVREWVDLLR